MEIGYIKLYRKITNSFVWTNPNMLKLWLLCLMKASHKESRFLFNGKEVSVSSGQFVTGRAVIEKEFNEGVPVDQQIVGRTLWRWLKKFENEQMLSITSTTKYSVISIKNWHDYQVNDQQVSSARPSTVQQVSTYKNDKNVKNDKNINNNSRKSAKRIYDENSIHYQLAQFFFQEIQKNNPEARPPNFQTWSDDIRKMMELDGRKEDQIKNMITWSQEHEFWSGVILSPKKLRDKYDQMKTQALKNYQPKKSYGNPNPKVEKEPDWMSEPQPTTEEMMPEDKQQEFLERLEKFRNGATADGN